MQISIKIIITGIVSEQLLLLLTEYCQDEELPNEICARTTNTNNKSYDCFFDIYNGVNVTAEPIRCCFCNNTLWWDCKNVTTLTSYGMQQEDIEKIKFLRI